MEECFDVVQLPRNLRREDMPDSMEVGRPFEVGGIKYVMAVESKSDLRVCSKIDSSSTTVPQPSGSYYVVKRM